MFEGTRAIGVRYRQDEHVREVNARREVIVCAGAINSPKLLQLSGVGPRPLLQRSSIGVVNDLPGVGENLRDHYTVHIAARVKSDPTINERSKEGKAYALDDFPGMSCGARQQRPVSGSRRPNLS